ncbi:PmoA family protein [Actinoplanes sp. CA-142083]|uniref:DUF6807 domain-containing protein n=1 Tax=Actinoplanes sp. CA-142083 TaxID=3239903 RepID=UPI003D8B98DB
MTDSAPLRLGDLVVAEYTWRPELPIALAPRPFLHPVRTLAGTVGTEAQPATHRHHLGAGFPVADVGGSNFWGSRTFVPGHGPAWLDNHGTQEHLRWIQQRPARLAHSLRWTAIDREQLLAERRTLAARQLDAREWALDWESVLTNTTGRTLPIRSPAVLGRAGAGFGGFFWRVATAARDCRVATATGEGTEAAHGSRSPWLLLAGPASGTPPWSLVFIGATERTRADRWFVRTRDYVGVGSALAWDEPLELAAGDTLTRRFVVVVADGILSPEQAAQRAAGLAS